MSKLANALGGINTPGASRLRGTGRMNYQAVQVGADPSYASKSKLIGTVGKLVEMGADAYGKYDASKKAKADERSNEIIRSLTPEQRRDAMKSGTLLYQDDPYAMEAYKEKTGRNAAFLIDDEVSQKVKNGEFRTRQEMEQYRMKRLTDGAKEFSDQFGLKESDEFFQRGFNSDITERNISLYGMHDNFLSDQAKKGAVINTRVELGAVLNDPQSLRSPDAGEFFEKYISNGLTTGSIPGDDQAYQMISQSLNDVVNKEGGTQFLQQVEGRKVTLNGVTSTYKELMGNEAWNNMMVKAQANEYQLNAKRMENFKLTANSAYNQEDPQKGWEMLQALKQQNDTMQPGEEMTPEREYLIQVEQQMQNRLKADSAAVEKAQLKQIQTTNKQSVIDAQFDKRMNGEYVSTAFSSMPSNEETGEFKHSDMVNFANNKLAEIGNMDIPEQQKDKLKLKYLRADSEDGAFRQAFGTMIDDAGKEWQAAVINGRLPEETPAMDALRKIRNTDPELMAALYPDKAEMFLTMDMMDNMGIEPQVLLDADKLAKGRTKEMQFESDRAWADLKNNSTSSELSRIPPSLDGGARKIFDSFYARTGNSDGAQQQVDKWLKENTVTFQSGDIDGKALGVIPRNSLRTTDDPDSYKQGQDIIEQAAKKLADTHPWITNKSLTIYEQGGSIYLMDTTGQVRIRYDKEMMQKVAQQEQEQAVTKVQQDKLKDANKRNYGGEGILPVNKRRQAQEKAYRQKNSK